MKSVDWYFDFISPFAYLASESLHRLSDDIELRPQPILFAGLLKHWQTKGPGEIDPMRRFTFRQIRWIADRDGIPLSFPPAHPFNPLKLLRLCIALECRPEVIRRLFRFVWAEGKSTDNAADWQQLCDDLGVSDGDALIADETVKSGLKANTTQALSAGVFGVPAFVVDGEVFWGYDAMDFLNEYINNPTILQSPGMLAADAMPLGTQRREIPDGAKPR